MKEAQYFTIRGYQKSGTNWLSNLVNLHPKVYCDGEYHFQLMKRGVMDFLNNGFRKRFTREVLTGYNDIVRSIMRKNSTGEGIEWYGDRTPVGLKPLLFDDVRQFFILRDGRDVLVSQVYHRLRHTFDGVANSPAEFKRVYKRFPALHETLTKFQKDPDYFEKYPEELLMDQGYVEYYASNWYNFVQRNLEVVKQSRRGDVRTSVHVVPYEHLHADIHGELARIFAFLELDPSEANPLDDKTSPGFKKTDNRSLFRKGKTGEWNRYFGEEQMKWYDRCVPPYEEILSSFTSLSETA